MGSELCFYRIVDRQQWHKINIFVLLHKELQVHPACSLIVVFHAYHTSEFCYCSSLGRLLEALIVTDFFFVYLNLAPITNINIKSIKFQAVHSFDILMCLSMQFSVKNNKSYIIRKHAVLISTFAINSCAMITEKEKQKKNITYNTRN